MTPNELIVLCVVLSAVVLFITDRVGLDLVSLLVIAALVVTDVLTPREGLAGFSDPATLTVAFMFVLSAALLRSGVLNSLGPTLSKQLRSSEWKGTLVLMLAVAAFSAFLNNTPIVAVLIPVVTQAARSAGISASRILIPLSFAAILGGTTTLIGTSTNILVSGIAADNGLAPFSMFQMAPMGLIILLAGVTYMMVFGRRMLPGSAADDDIEEGFGPGDYVTEFDLHSTSSAVGQRIMDAALVKDLHLDIIEVRRGEERFTLPAGDVVLLAGDRLKVRCDVENIKRAKQRDDITVRAWQQLDLADNEDPATTLVELVITSNSPLDGRTVGDADLLRRYRAVPLAVRKREEVLNEAMQHIRLRSGDVILAEVRSHYVERLRELGRAPESPFVILAEQEGGTQFDRRNALIAALTMVGVVLTAAFGLLPIAVSTLLGLCIVVLTGCMNMNNVYKAIDWKVVFLMAGAVSLGLAMESSGLADRIANGLIDQIGALGPVAVLSTLYLCTVLLTEVMSNTATAALLAPIAISAGAALQVSPQPFLMAVTFAASASFMTPIGYQTNTMIYSAGRYKYTDFLKVGTPMAVLLWVLATLLIPVIYPF